MADLSSVTIEATIETNAEVDVGITSSPDINVEIIGSGPTGPQGIQGPPGQDGTDGQDGQDGADGVSPVISSTSITGGHRLTIVDAGGTTTVDVMDGQDGTDGTDGTDGQDGVSPEVTIASITGGHSVTITDADHPGGQTFNVMDGADGQDGAPGQDGQDGVGVPSGGTTGQVLKKKSNTDYDTEWGDQSGLVLSVNGKTGAVVLDSEDLDHNGEPIADILGTSVTDTGSIVTFEDAVGGHPLRQLTLAIEPVQDLNGYGNPWPAGGGKNIAHDVTYTSASTQYHVVIAGTFSIISGKRYVFSFTTPNTGERVYRQSPSTLGFSSLSGYSFTCDGGRKSFYGTASSDTTLTNVSIVCKQDNDSIAVGLCSEFMIEEVEDTVTTPSDYAPYSNICPISGWTEAKVTRTGENLFNKSTVTDGSRLSSTGGAYSDTAYYYSAPIAVEAGKTYTKNSPSIDAYHRFCAYRTTSMGNDSFIRKVDDSNSVTIADGENYIRICGLKTEKDTTRVNLASSVETLTIDLNGTRYGGVLDVLTGVMTLTHVSTTFNSATGWSYKSAATEPGVFSKTITPHYKKYLYGATAPDSALMCDTLKTAFKSGGYNDVLVNGLTAYSGGDTVNYIFYLCPENRGFTTVSELDNWLSANPLQVVYELETPQTVQLTAQQVSSLLGTNVLFADTGNVTVIVDTGLLAGVQSVNGKSGAVALTASDVGARPDTTPLPVTSGTGDRSIISVSPSNPNVASATVSIALGQDNTASGTGAVSIGTKVSGESGNTSSGNGSVAIGSSLTASGNYAVALGTLNTSSGQAALTAGRQNTANASFSSAIGVKNIASGAGSFVIGARNEEDINALDATRGITGARKYLLIVGNGTADNARSNAMTVDWDGNEVLAGKLTLGAAPTANMDATTKKYVDDAISGVAPSTDVVWATYGTTTSADIEAAYQAGQVVGVMTGGKVYYLGKRDSSTDHFFYVFISTTLYVCRCTSDSWSNYSYSCLELGDQGTIPSGGNSGQVLSKASASDYDVHWVNQTQDYPSAYCITAAATAAKKASCSLWVDTANSYLHVLIGQANSYAGAITLNVNSTGAKPIYINGSASSATNYTLPAGSYIVKYDGTNFQFRTDGKLPADITGNAANGVSLSSTWSGSGPYTQAVTVSGVTITSNSKVDIQPDATAIAQMISDGCAALYIDNNAGTLTAYAIGAATTAALTLQVTVTEVS